MPVFGAQRKSVIYLNAVVNLKKKKISSYFKNIHEKLNSGSELKSKSDDVLKGMINYCCEIRYLIMNTYNSNILYGINENMIIHNIIFARKIPSPFSSGIYRWSHFIR